MKFYFKLIICINLFISTNSFSNEWIDIQEFTIWASNYSEDIIRISVQGGKTNPGNCGDPDSYMVLASLDDRIQDRIYGLLLAAHMGNKPIKARIVGCQSNRPAIDAVRIEP